MSASRESAAPEVRSIHPVVTKRQQIMDRRQHTGKNIGAKWPTDTLLKCIPDDSNIYFFHLKITDGVWSYNDESYEVFVFPVKILFKNYNKFSKINKLSCHLLSDRYGKIGNKIGKMEIIINDY